MTCSIRGRISYAIPPGPNINIYYGSALGGAPLREQYVEIDILGRAGSTSRVEIQLKYLWNEIHKYT